MKRSKASKEAVRRQVQKNVKDSAKLEGREVPEGFVRSQKVQEFLDARRSKNQ